MARPSRTAIAARLSAMPSSSRRPTVGRASRSSTDPSVVSVYDPFARFYDLDTEGIDADLPFWIGLARRAGGPILEIGCGTGRVLIPLAEAGFRVVGVDVSSAMLAIARDKVAASGVGDHVELVQADALSLDLGQVFAFVFIALN